MDIIKQYSPNFWNKIQADLVIVCEKPHEYGIRHKGLSGFIVEQFLMEQLRKIFPVVNFDIGIIANTEEKIVNFESDDKRLSNQIDIICYHGEPERRMFDVIIVPTRKVLAVIEVKKKIIEKELPKIFKKVKQFLPKEKMIFVGFRSTFPLNELKEMANKQLGHPAFFFGKEKKGLKGKPDYIDPEEWLYKDEFYRLIKHLSEIINE